MNTQEKKIEQISDNVYVMTGSTNIGIVTANTQKSSNRELYLIDSGTGSDDAEKTESCLISYFGTQITIRAIINTHSHADHAGSNSWFQNKYKCGIWATEGEKSAIEYPEFQAAILWGGRPISDLQNKFYTALPSHVSRTLIPDELIHTENVCFKIIPLPGHFLTQIGILITDGSYKSIFTGDAFFGRHMIAKYWIPYVYNIKKFKESLFKLTKIEADFYISAHDTIETSIEADIELNLIATLETEKAIITILKKPHSTEDILKEIADMNHITLKIGQYALIGSTLKSYLSYLYDEKKIAYTIKNNSLLWYTL